MAVDMFLKLEGIEGESTDSKHRGEIDVQSFSWGLSQAGTTAGAGGATTGRPSVQGFHFVANTGIQSPPLLVAGATAQRFPRATLTVRKAGEQPLEFLKVSLEDVLVSSYQVGGTEGGDVPVDQFSLNFAKIRMSVARVAADGTVTGYVEGGYDVVANRKI